MTDETPTAQPGTAVAAPVRKLDLTAIKGAEHGGGMTFLPRTMQECLDFATVMSKSDFAIPPKFRGNPGACLAVTIQAARWEADPFGVIQKAYVTKSKDQSERLAYEAQLVAAIVNTRAPIIGRLQLIYSGDGNTRRVKVIGVFRDTGEPREIETPPVGKITVKNSPLWTSDPDQQLAYYGMRAWGRRWVPEVLLGIYTPEELMEQPLVDAPRPSREPVQVIEAQATEGIVKAPEPEPVVIADDEVEEVIDQGQPITQTEAARVDEMEGRREDVAEETAAVDDDAEHRTAVESWEGYLQRAVDGLQAPELLKEADFDDYGRRTKEAIASADGLTEDEKDDMRARFVSALLNVKRDRGFGRTRR